MLVAVGRAALAGPAPAAQAHAFLAASNPADGQVLATAPTQLRLDFSESVVLGATRIDIVDGAGRHITPTGLKLVSHGDAGDTEQPVEVVADLPTLARSSYRVSWETLSSDDLHSTSGVLVFGVGQPVTAGGLDEPSPSPLEAGLRWLILLGLSGALGGALAIRLLDRTGGPGASRRALARARKLSARGAIIGAGFAVILLVAQLRASGAGAASLLWSSYGVRWGLREAGLLMLVCSATARLRTLRTRTNRLLLAAGAALACGGTALLGHSGAGAAPNITRVIASAAHLGAAATWAGCVVVLAFVLVLHVRGGAPSRDFARSVLRGFGPPAAVCVAVMVVTGVYLSSKVIGSVDAALFTIYGRTLLAKVMLAGVRRLAGPGEHPAPAPSRRASDAPPNGHGRGGRCRGGAGPGRGAYQRPAGDGAAAGSDHHRGSQHGRGRRRGRPAGGPCRSAPTGRGPASSWLTSSTRAGRLRGRSARSWSPSSVPRGAASPKAPSS